jgi:hypothetical protein
VLLRTAEAQIEYIVTLVASPLQLQIPIRSVIKITKERTAKIIPNAVGLETADEKHVFGSLISRDTTFKFITVVWKRAIREMNPADAVRKYDAVTYSNTRQIKIMSLVQ